MEHHDQRARWFHGVVPELLLSVVVVMANQGLLRVDDLAADHAIDRFCRRLSLRRPARLHGRGYTTYYASAGQQPNTYAADVANYKSNPAATNTDRVLWGCIGMHLSGSWYDSNA